MSGGERFARIYYARGVEALKWPAVALRAARASAQLAQHGFEVIDPVVIGRALGFTKASDVIETDLRQLSACDAVLMDMSIPKRNYVGCCCELVYAFQWRIPVVVYVGRSGNEKRKWLIYHATAACTSFREAIATVVETVTARRSS